VAFICLHAAASLWQVLSIAIQVTHPEDNLGLWATAETMGHLNSLHYYKGKNFSNCSEWNCTLCQQMSWRTTFSTKDYGVCL